MVCLLVYADKNTNEVEAKAFLDEYNSTAEVVWNAYTEASWSYNTDINDATRNEMVSKSDGTSGVEPVTPFPGGTLSVTDLPCLVLLIQRQL